MSKSVNTSWNISGGGKADGDGASILSGVQRISSSAGSKTDDAASASISAFVRRFRFAFSVSRGLSDSTPSWRPPTLKSSSGSSGGGAGPPEAVAACSTSELGGKEGSEGAAAEPEDEDDRLSVREVARGVAFSFCWRG